jgi:hypothetical protein
MRDTPNNDWWCVSATSHFVFPGEQAFLKIWSEFHQKKPASRQGNGCHEDEETERNQQYEKPTGIATAKNPAQFEAAITAGNKPPQNHCGENPGSQSSLPVGNAGRKGSQKNNYRPEEHEEKDKPVDFSRRLRRFGEFVHQGWKIFNRVNSCFQLEPHNQ